LKDSHTQVFEHLTNLMVPYMYCVSAYATDTCLEVSDNQANCLLSD